jgi:type IV pilus assembly protein PilA
MKKNNKGFSLIELIIVIAIMAVLVAIIAPNLTKYLGKSKQQTDKTNLEEIKKQVKNCISEAATDEKDVMSTETSASSTAVYTVIGNGSSHSVTAGANGTSDFATYLNSVFDDDLNTKSKVNTGKTSVVVTITGWSSEGYTVQCQFS